MIANHIEPEGFDLVRITKAKKIVDVCPNTIRAYGKQGLPLYKCSKALFFSRSELAAFIRDQAAKSVRVA